MTLFASVVALLDREHIPCAVIGAGALAVHGIPRSTYDIDLLTMSPRALDDTLWAGLAEGGAEVDVRSGDITDPLRGVVRVRQGDQRDVDVVVGRQKWQGDAIARAQPARVLGQDVPVVTISDLILLKLYAGGHQDVWDVEQLLTISGADIRAEVNARIEALPSESQDRWAEMTRRPDLRRARRGLL